MKKESVFFIYLLTCGILCQSLYGQEVKAGEAFNPFRPRLPKPEQIPVDPGQGQKPAAQPVRFDAKIPIEGLVWGTDLPQAIIEGKVYSVGDELKEYGAKISSIDKKGISVEFEGNIYLVPIQQSKGKESR